MLQLKNDTPFPASIAIFADPAGVDTVYVTVRAAFDLGGAVRVAEKQQPIRVTDEYHDDPESSSLRHAGEVHPSKPGTDVALVGHAFAPLGRAVAHLDVSLRVGPVKKVVRVFGEREWYAGQRITSAVPFERMPLVYERAFGGVLEHDASGAARVFPQNPVGVGPSVEGAAPASIGAGPASGRVPAAGPPSARSLPPRSSDARGPRLPNLEDPSQLITTPSDRPPPAGFGFIAPAWEPRRTFAGTYDESWRKTRAPYLPRDFDARFFQAAHPDLVCKAHLVGGEPVEVVHASPTPLPRFLVPVCEFDVGVRIGRRTETAAMLLETVVVEPDDLRLSLVYRGAVACGKHPLAVREARIALRRMLPEGRRS
jgi:hypothetical protein